MILRRQRSPVSASTARGKFLFGVVPTRRISGSAALNGLGAGTQSALTQSGIDPNPSGVAVNVAQKLALGGMGNNGDQSRTLNGQRYHSSLKRASLKPWSRSIEMQS